VQNSLTDGAAVVVDDFTTEILSLVVEEVLNGNLWRIVGVSATRDHVGRFKWGTVR